MPTFGPESTMPRILMIAHFSDGADEDSNNRFNYLLKLFREQCDARLVTSSYAHRHKSQRSPAQSRPWVQYVWEPGYRRHGSPVRLFCHWVSSLSLRLKLARTETPDLVYCAIPSISWAGVAARYATRHRIPLVIDVQDLWPEAFAMLRYGKWLTRLAYPIRRRARKVYRSADLVVAVSQSYADHAVRCRDDEVATMPVFLGTELRRFDAVEPRRRSNGTIQVAYVGTLSMSYNLRPVIEAINALNAARPGRVRLVVMGDGPDSGKLREFAESSAASVEFTGHLAYDSMVSRLKSCDIAINPITHTSSASIINKVGDYAAAGLPVINTQASMEYRELLARYGAGVSVRAATVDEIRSALDLLCEDSAMRKSMGEGSRVMAEQLFDRAATYRPIVQKVIDMVSK